MINQINYNNELNKIIQDLEQYNKFNQNEKTNLDNFKLQENLSKNKLIVEKELNKIKEKNTILVTEIEYDSKYIEDNLDKIEIKTEIEKTINNIEYKLELYSIYKGLVHKKCIPSLLLKEKLKFIENDINEHLESLVNFQIEMFIDTKFTFNN